MYGAELTTPTSHECAAVLGPESVGMPNSVGKERSAQGGGQHARVKGGGGDSLAPLEPVWSQPWVAAPMEQRKTVM